MPVECPKCSSDNSDSLRLFYETDHIPPVNEMIKETLAWLDKYLSPVKK
jgi:hypothetical protein